MNLGRKRQHRNWLDNMGLTMHEGRLAYGMDHGWLMWAPMWVKHAIVKIWNPLVCMARGHDKILVELYKVGEMSEPPTCVNCCTELPVDGKYVTPVREPWWKKKPSKEEVAEWNSIVESPDLPEDSPDPK